MLKVSLLSGAELFFIYIILLYLVLSRLCPFVLAWIIQYKYNCSITIGRITLPYLALRNVRVNTNGYSIFIDRIGFTSSFVNSEAPKLLSVVITVASIVKTHRRPWNQSGGSSGSPSGTPIRRKKLRAPSFVSNLVQFLGIHINEVNLWSWVNLDERKGVHFNTQIQNVSVDGCTTVGGTSICACIVLNLERVKARVSENWLPTDEDLESPLGSSYFNGQSGLTLLENNFDFRLNLIFSPRNSGEFLEHFSVEVERLIIRWELKERCLNLLCNFQKTRPVESPLSDGLSVSSWIKKMEDMVLTQCVPKEIKIRIFETECRISDEDSQTNFESRVSGFCFTSRCQISVIESVETISFESQFDLGLIRIEPDPHQCLSVDQFSNYIKLDNLDLKMDLDITSFSLKSYERMLQFSKIKLMSNSRIVEPTGSNDLILQEAFQSAGVKFEISELDLQYNEKHGSVNTVYIVADSKDLKQFLSDDMSSVEIVIKNLVTSLNYNEDGMYRPVSFDLLGFHLQREQIGAKLSGSRFQIIPKLLEFVQTVLPIPKVSVVDAANREESKHRKTLQSYLKGVNLEVFDSKLVYVSENNLCLNADLGTLFSTSDTMNRTVSVEGFEVFSSSNYSDCTLNPLLTIPKAELKTHREDASLRYNVWINLNTKLYWSPLLHLQISEFVDKVKTLLPANETKISDRGDTETTPKIVTVTFEKSFSIVAKLAKNHSVKFKAENLKVLKGPDLFDMSFKALRISFDGTRVGKCEDFCISKGPKTYGITKAYRKSARLSVKQNQSWFVEMSVFALTFPYGYNFASAYNEEFVSCFKWLKKQRKNVTVDLKSVWSDLFIKIKSARIEVGDDPFEVKLRDNYELLEDEYFENLKRTQVLDAKINQLYKNNILMSSSKMDELRNQLKEKSSTIYIQRSKKLYEKQAIRSHLLLWELNDVQIITMADPTMHGKEKIIHIIQELDPDSPWPMDGALDFSTLWCRVIHFDVTKWRVQLRDFPQPLMDSRNIHYWGKLAAAEAQATKRSTRRSEIEIGGPFAADYVDRNMNTLKWYYDLNCDVEALSMAFGPCWEPVLAQCNLAFENILSPARDPSRPLPFWDKIRFLFHGRLYLAVNTLTHLLHASLNPYNTTEEMQVTWTDVAIAWMNGKIIFEGDLNIYVRTASKYDDCRMLHLPNVRLTFKLRWVCLADANDHHSVSPCAPDKLPEYSSNQEHDSYRAFRSQNLNMDISLETRANRAQNSFPAAKLFGSTLRWFENLKLILSGTTRPTRRGVLFNNTKQRKVPISRHYKNIRLSVSLNRFDVCYWVSFSMQSGIEISSGKLSSSSEHTLTLLPMSDGLIHRPKADWSVVYVNCELNDSEIWLQSSLQQDSTSELNYIARPIEKFFFMSIDKLSYLRDELLHSGAAENAGSSKKDTPQHRLVVHELKGAWTGSNRDVAFSLFDSFVKVQQLKKNLSTEALKSFFSKHDGPSGSPLKSKNGNGNPKLTPRHPEVLSPSTHSQGARNQMGSSPLSGIQGQSAAASLLQKLISEAESRGVVFSEDLAAPPPQQSLHGLAQSSLDDVILQKWLIELVNCQVLLKGCETSGYVILSASKAHIIQREHKPVWKNGTIVPKTTWVGALEGMQYYATVAAGSPESPEENIQWLSVENIEERYSSAMPNEPEMVGSGQSVGGVVSETVGGWSDESNGTVQLQRIVSRCRCEFYYTTFGETGVDKIPSGVPEIPTAPRDLELWDEINKPVEAFTLMHYDLNIFTNSLQYAMILDIVNNLVLYVDPKRKEAFEKLQRLRFKLQLQSTEAQRRPIQQLQNHLRTQVNQLRRLEKEMYLLEKSLSDDSDNDSLLSQKVALQQQVNETKEQVAAKGEELHMMVLCYKESKLAATQRLSRKRDNKDVSLVRVYEICFKHAQWRLTQTDGQLGIADLVLSNFLYTKTAKSDDSVEHLCELGYITVTNLLPNQIYKEILIPTLLHASMPVDRQRTLRVFCRDRPPVGGIAVKELFEINISPITIGMTYQFFKTLFKFCFPEKDPDKLDDVDVSSSDSDSIASVPSSSLSSSVSSTVAGGSTITIDSTVSNSGIQNPKGKRPRVKRKESKFYVSMNEKDDVEKMKERAERNMLFICVKVPEVPVRVSYKGEKDKNIEDLQDVEVNIPTLEYNNITWTWLDFLVAVRNHSKKVLLQQAIKQKVLGQPRTRHDLRPNRQEEDKAKLLLGLPGDSKSLKKSLFGPHKKH